MDPFSGEIFGGADMYVDDLVANMTPPVHITQGSPNVENTAFLPRFAIPQINNFSGATADSGFLFSGIVGHSIFDLPVWGVLVYMILVFVFIFTAGDFLSLRSVLGNYIYNPFFMVVPLIAFIFLFTSLSNSVAIGIFLIALLVVNNSNNPVIKVLLLIASVGHMILNSYRSKNVFSDYDMWFIVLYILLLIPLYSTYNKTRMFVPYYPEMESGKKSVDSITGGELDKIDSLWSETTDLMTQS